MYSRTILFLVILVTVGPLGGCGAKRMTHDDLQPVKIIQRYYGQDAGLTESGLMLVSSRDELEALGSYQLIDREINFDDHSLIVLALGHKSTAGYSVRITGAQSNGRELFVQAIVIAPGTDDMAAQVMTYLYDAVAIEKVAPGIELYSEIDSVLGTPMAAE